MNLGDLSFALNCDPIKNEIRKMEMINKRSNKKLYLF